MDLTEKTLESREVYRGRILRVREDRVLLPNGQEAQREIVEHPGGVGILALDADGCAVMVRQYRYAFGQTLLEIPAGKREKGEQPDETARRELQEEVGATAREWQSLGEVIASPGCYDEVLYLYLARDLTFGAQHPDEDEFLNVERIPFDELLRRCLQNEAGCENGGSGAESEAAVWTVKWICFAGDKAKGRAFARPFSFGMPSATNFLPAAAKNMQKMLQETIGFLRIFGYFLCAQKVPRRRPDKPIQEPT